MSAILHELKIDPEFFNEVVVGRKVAEVRLDDGRNFKKGDYIWLREWDISYSGNAALRKISYVQGLEAIATDDRWKVLHMAKTTIPEVLKDLNWTDEVCTWPSDP
jgi:ASC-1-like (ASCH) protein